MSAPRREAPPPIVDVAFTAYRRATFVAEAVESVLDQRFERWRLTICDNGRGGGEVERATAPYLADARVTYVAAGRELTLAENWTRALAQGHGAYVALLNDDDRWNPAFLEDRIAALDAHPECGFAFAECMLVDEEGRPLLRAPARFREGVLSREELARRLTRETVVVPPTIVVRRAAYEAVGAAFDGRWHYCDWEMWARLAARFPAYYLHRQDTDYRRHAQVNTFATTEDPERLLAFVDHLEQLFSASLPGFELGGRDRRRNRSRILLGAAADVHQGGGWAASSALHRRAIREHPPAALDRASLAMLGRSLLGRRGRRVVGRALEPIRRRRQRKAESAGAERAA